ncbi:Retrovirus-related Pol polyprotein from transposon RE1 [Vitis vinifera]|uniref:Retrovirus-related Pol polyprotein from transposon RE1 n=1 Tax=Vitis vinifera TaxID=29760 RepID=A0A438I7Q0_VITVI|nr:Retrovirus-related Pol polyprotein from transposon RE1 [Vitis vinifera]
MSAEPEPESHPPTTSPQTPVHNYSKSPQTANNEFSAYIRRKRPKRTIEQPTPLTYDQESQPSPSTTQIHSGKGTTDLEKLVPFVDDSNIPTALSKGVPNSIQEAIKNPKWRKTVSKEIRALEKNETWVIYDLPHGKKPVGCKWIFTIKHKADGSIERLKARLVAKGFTQSYGIDYRETFAQVGKLNTIRVLFSLTMNQYWPLHQLDVKNASLNGNLEEKVYMEIPPGLETSFNNNRVCKLKKSLYGLKQSPRAWFDKFAKSVRKQGYTQCQADHTLFVKFSSEKKIAVLIVYVDDIILTGDYEEELLGMKKQLAKEFEIKDLDYLRYFFGSVVSQFMNNPTEEHMEAVNRILRYLKMTLGKGLLYKKNDTRDVEVLSDANWVGDVLDRRSTSGYCFMYGEIS